MGLALFGREITTLTMAIISARGGVQRFPGVEVVDHHLDRVIEGAEGNTHCRCVFSYVLQRCIVPFDERKVFNFRAAVIRRKRDAVLRLLIGCVFHDCNF